MQVFWIIGEAVLLIGIFSGAGALLDVYIGETGRRRTRRWFRKEWYSFQKARWRQLGVAEAIAFLRLSDQVFGRTLFSAKRFASVAIVGLGTPSLLILMVGLHGRWPWDDNVIRYFPYQWPGLVVLVLAALSFGLSVSLTRAVTALTIYFARLAFATWELLLTQVLLQYFITIVWGFVGNELRVTAVAFASMLAGNTPIGDLFHYLHNDIDVVFSILSTAIHNPVGLLSTAIHQVASVPDTPILYCNYIFLASTVCIFFIASLIRTFFLLILVGSFLIRHVFGHVISVYWARSWQQRDQPVLTFSLGLVGTLVALVKSVVTLVFGISP